MPFSNEKSDRHSSNLGTYSVVFSDLLQMIKFCVTLCESHFSMYIYDLKIRLLDINHLPVHFRVIRLCVWLATQKIE